MRARQGRRLDNQEWLASVNRKYTKPSIVQKTGKFHVRFLYFVAILRYSSATHAVFPFALGEPWRIGTFFCIVFLYQNRSLPSAKCRLERGIEDVANLAAFLLTWHGLQPRYVI